MLKVINDKGLDIVKMKAVVEQDSVFVLTIDEDISYTGTLDELKEKLASYIKQNGELPDYDFALCTPLKGIYAEFEKNYKVEMDDNEYDERDETFIIRDGNQGNRVIDEYRYEEDALDALAELIKDYDGEEDRFNLERKIEYGCLYTIDSEIEVNVIIPQQEVDVYLEKASPVNMYPEPAPLELLPKVELMKKMLDIQTELNRRHEEEQKKHYEDKLKLAKENEESKDMKDTDFVF